MINKHDIQKSNNDYSNNFQVLLQKLGLWDIPSTFEDSIAWYQALKYVLNYLMENIIPNVQENDEKVNELITAYNEVVDYCNNYFDNLNVQNEINNKLDLMYSLGQIASLAEPYFRASMSDTRPIAVSSSNEMTDTSRLYVNTTNGNWYYFNGTNWVSGGLFQATTVDDNSITPQKTTFCEIQKNKFNKNGSLIGYALNGSNVTSSNANRFVTNYIYVNKDDIIRFFKTTSNGVENTYYTRICALNDNDEVIDTGSGSSNTTSYTVPEGVTKVRCSFDISYLDTLQITVNTMNNRYEPFRITNEQHIYDFQNSNFLEVGRNKFDKTKALLNYTLNTGGTYASNDTRFTSDFIKVNINDIIRCNNSMVSLVFYDENYNYLSHTLGTYVKSFTAPSTGYFRFSSYLETIDTTCITLNNTDTSFEDFKIYTKGGVTHEELKSFTNLKTIHDVFYNLVNSENTINVKLIGDSITHGVGGTGFVNDAEHGAHIVGNQYVNTTGHCWANSLKSYLEQKFNCSCLNYGTRGFTSSQIIQYFDNLVKSTDDIIICMIGTNDRNTSTENIINNLQTIYDNVKSLGKEIIFMSSIPASINDETGKLLHMEDVDNCVMYVSNKNNQEYISIYKDFINYCDYKNVTIDSLLNDGLHPNDDGYDVMYHIVLNHLGFGIKTPGATW